MKSKPHILVVDDDQDLRFLVGDYLESNGCVVTLAADGEQMQQAIMNNDIHLIILDVMLPEVDGLTLCKNIRVNSDIPILILTAKSEPIERILGLELGADDYLTKPFEPRELLARIKSIIRRADMTAKVIKSDIGWGYVFSGWTLDARSHDLTSPRGIGVSLSASEYRLLTQLLDHPNQILSRDQLMESVVGREQEPFDRSIDTKVCRLRQKLDDDARSPEMIKTLRNEGYIFVGNVERYPR
ncbi:MAG: response regulator transcription factor [Methylococcus sp.]|jgi:two-component system OmpR family response regulator